MKRLFTESQRERGNITVIALMILVVLTLAGIMASRTSTTDIQIAGNEIPYKQDFFIAEGGLTREASELGRGNYAVMQINTPSLLANQGSPSLPAPTPHEVAGNSYNFTVGYLGYFLPPPGYSVIHFSRYDYDIDAVGAKVNVESRYYKIGPKAE